MKDIEYYMSLPYRVEVVEDKEEGGWELPGCATCAGSVEEGFRLIEDAKRSWLDACIEDGREIPEPIDLNAYSGQFKLRIPKSLHRRLAQRSSEEGVSMNQYCVYLLSRGV